MSSPTDSGSGFPNPMEPHPKAIATSLPLPTCHAGYIFMAYAAAVDSPWHFCECTRVGITNYLENALAEKRERLRAGKPIAQGRYNSIIDFSFPRRVREEFWQENFSNDEVLSHLRFAPAICHRCHRAVPPFVAAGSASYFRAVFQLLIYRELAELGFSFIAAPFSHLRTEAHIELLPSNYAELVSEQRAVNVRLYSDPAVSIINSPPGYWRARRELGEKARKLNHEVQAIHDHVYSYAEQRVRKHYDFPQFKEKAQRETVLFLNLRALYRDEEVLRRARPDFLEGLELDVWIPRRRLGFEFQGAQHLKAFEYLGGEKGLRTIQARDRRKAELCDQHGVRLLEFFESDDLNEHVIAARLRAAGIW